MKPTQFLVFVNFLSLQHVLFIRPSFQPFSWLKQLTVALHARKTIQNFGVKDHVSLWCRSQPLPVPMRRWLKIDVGASWTSLTDIILVTNQRNLANRMRIQMRKFPFQTMRRQIFRHAPERNLIIWKGHISTMAWTHGVQYGRARPIPTHLVYITLQPNKERLHGVQYAIASPVR